jgi:hypothetical protein
MEKRREREIKDDVRRGDDRNNNGRVATPELAFANQEKQNTTWIDIARKAVISIRVFLFH